MMSRAAALERYQPNGPKRAFAEAIQTNRFRATHRCATSSALSASGRRSMHAESNFVNGFSENGSSTVSTIPRSSVALRDRTASRDRAERAFQNADRDE